MSPDLSLHSALTHLLARLCTTPLKPLLPPTQLSLLQSHLRSNLTLLFAPSWTPSDPSRGSAFRSLIGRPAKLPRPLRLAAEKAAVDLALWENALADVCDGQTEWQCWCDPGRVSWRNGGWEWEDGVWFFGGWKDSTTTLWSTPLPAPTPRASHAITIRSPIPATPLSTSNTPMPSHLPSRSITPPTPTRSVSPYPTPLTSANLLALPLPGGPFERPQSPSAESNQSCETFTSVSESGASTLSQTSSSHPAIHSDGRHLLPSTVPLGGHKRISSVSSATSSASASSIPSRSTSPANLDVGGKKKPTAYDGGKVGVLGGGVKLGGGGGGGGGTPASPRKRGGQHSRSRSSNRNQQAPFGQPLFALPSGYQQPFNGQGVFGVGY